MYWRRKLTTYGVQRTHWLKGAVYMKDFFSFSVTTQRALLETDHAICLYIEDTGIFKYVIQTCGGVETGSLFW